MARPIRLEYLTQPGHVTLYQVHGIPGRRLTPHGIDQLLPADRPARLQAQHGQDDPLLDRPEIYAAFAPPGAERAQYAEPQRRIAWVSHAASPTHRRIPASVSRKASSPLVAPAPTRP